jgi:hypothetical protein
MNAHTDELTRIAMLPDDDCDIHIALRSLLIDPTTDLDELRDECPAALPHIDAIARHIAELDAECAQPYRSDAITARSLLLLDYSLCPLHRIDYAACFDDLEPDCAQIRALFPSHDT